MPDQKIIFAVNLPLKLFRATVANADIRSLKSLHIFLTKCLYHMPVKFEKNSMVQTTPNCEPFDKNKTKTKQNKTKQNKTKQNKTKQNKTKQNKTKQNKTKQNKTKQNKTKQNETKQNKKLKTKK